MKLSSGQNKVEFLSNGTKLVGNLFCPAPFNPSLQYSAIVVAGPMGTVKKRQRVPLPKNYPTKVI
jgi:hypothetical protein